MTTPDLRALAEHALRAGRRDFSALATLDAEEARHELQIKHVELELQHEHIEHLHQQYQKLFERAPLGYLVLDRSGAVQRANATALRMLGVPSARLLGQPFAACVAALDLEAIERQHTQSMPGTRAAWEVRLRPALAGVTHVRIDTSLIPDAPGCMVLLTDISERAHDLESEHRLHIERETDLAGRITELEAANRALETKMAGASMDETQRLYDQGVLRDADRLQSLGMLAAGVAHDFNNLLVGILGHAELLLQAPTLPEEWREQLSVIRRAARSASDLTRQLLVFAGVGRVSMAPVDFGSVVTEAAELLQSDLYSGIPLRTRIDADLPHIMANRGQIYQVTMNLLTNAIEAIGGRGEISISLREQLLDASALASYQPRTDAAPGSFVILQVRDTGPGIEAATQVRIFDPFFTTKFTGRGLGLATALGIVRSHHGTIRVRSLAGDGTMFEVAFPVAGTPRESSRPTAKLDNTWVGSGTVLLIDDDAMVRKVMTQLLERLGFSVTAAHSGEDGLEKFRNSVQPFDFVVLDWLMPGVSGEQVLNTLRILDPELAVLLVSGYSVEDLAKYDRRAVRLHKPMTLLELKEAMSLLAGQAQANRTRARRPRPVLS